MKKLILTTFSFALMLSAQGITPEMDALPGQNQALELREIKTLAGGNPSLRKRQARKMRSIKRIQRKFGIGETLTTFENVA
jgi:hypothetical protein